MRFYDVSVNQSVPTEANRGLASYNSTKSYIEALTKGLLPYYRYLQLFMQDNVGIHCSN
jgi:hypothetical protein